MNVDTDHAPFTKTDSKQITDLSVKRKAIRFLEGNTGENQDGPKLMTF